MTRGSLANAAQTIAAGIVDRAGRLRVTPKKFQIENFKFQISDGLRRRRANQKATANPSTATRAIALQREPGRTIRGSRFVMKTEARVPARDDRPGPRPTPLL